MANRDKTLHGAGEEEFLRNYDASRFERPSVAVDTVIFSVDAELQSANYRKLEEQKLTVLLLKRDRHPFMGRWSLPGGFVAPDETLERTADRVIRSKTSLGNIYLEQLYTFGLPGRDPRTRVISCAYLALIDRARHKLGESGSGLRWFELEMAADGDALRLCAPDECLTVPVRKKSVRNGRVDSVKYLAAGDSGLAFDHADMILEALMRLRGKIDYTDIVFNLMPDVFSITQLQRIYEIILGEKLLPAAFRRKIAHKIEETGEYIKDKGHRPSRLFRYKADREQGGKRP